MSTNSFDGRNSDKRIERVEHFLIMGGPCKDRIFDACKYAFENIAIDLDFRIVPSSQVFKEDNPEYPVLVVPVKNIRITSIQYENNSSDNELLLSGYCNAALDPLMQQKKCKFSAYYDCGNGTGWINIMEIAS